MLGNWDCCFPARSIGTIGQFCASAGRRQYDETYLNADGIDGDALALEALQTFEEVVRVCLRW